MIQLLVFFIRFVLSTSTIIPNTIKDNTFPTEWQCKTKDRHIFIGTSNGILHFINVFTGKIDFSIDTGGDIFNFSANDAYSFLPTIGNFFSSNIDSNNKLLSTNNGEIAISSVQSKSAFLVDETNGIIGCSKSENSLNNNQQNQENSGMIATCTTGIVDNSNLPPGSTKIERTDYSIIINGERSKIFKYSYFDIKTSETMQALYSQDVRLFTSLDGHIKLVINNTIKSNQKIIGMPVVVFSTDGLLHFSPHTSDLQISTFANMAVKTEEQPQTKILKTASKHDIAKTNQIIFVQEERNAFSTPVVSKHNSHLPQKMSLTSSKENGKIIQNNFIKQTDTNDMTSDMKFTINAEIDLKSKSQTLFSTRNKKKRNENVNFAMHYNYNSNNNKNWIALPIVTFFAFAITIIAIYVHLENEKKQRFIIIDSNFLSSSSNCNQKCLKKINYDIIKKIESAASETNNQKYFAFPLKIEEHQLGSNRDDGYNCYYLVTSPLLEQFRFDQKFDAVDFLRRTLTAIDIMHSNGIVHAAISDEAFFISSSENGAVVIGLIEEKSHYSSSKSDFDADIIALKSILKNHISNASTLKLFELNSLYDDQIFNDFLSNHNFLNAKDILDSHPLFMTDLQKIKIFEDAYALFLADSDDCLGEFDSHGFEIFGRTWARKIPKTLLFEASRKRRYNTSSLRDLVALIRNKWVHRATSDSIDTKIVNKKGKNQWQKNSSQQSSTNSITNNNNNNNNRYDLGVQAVYGNGSPECYFDYFNRKFPKLFVYVYNFCRLQKLKNH